MHDEKGDGPPVTRLLRDPASVERRRGRLQEPHMVPLSGLVERIRSETGRHDVPWFDPDSGGINARVLLMLEAPGRRSAGTAARAGSGFVSPDNNDQTAHNVSMALHEAGLDRSDVLAWNIVPWYIGTDEAIRAAHSRDIADALPWLDRLLVLLPRLRAVVTLGKNAQRGWQQFVAAAGWSKDDLVVLAAPHPSPKVVNTQPQARAAIVTVLRRAAALASES